MKSRRQNMHLIDFVFTIAIFAVFTASALLAVIIGANAYKSISSNMKANYNERTALAYVSEKVRQHDVAGSIEVAELDSISCLMLHDTYGDQTYTTYIYQNDGYLCELFTNDKLGFAASDGERIMELRSFKAAEVDAGEAAAQLIQIATVDLDNQAAQIYLSVKSNYESGGGR